MGINRIIARVVVVMLVIVMLGDGGSIVGDGFVSMSMVAVSWWCGDSGDNYND